MNRPALALIGVGIAAVAGTAAIPVPRTLIDFREQLRELALPQSATSAPADGRTYRDTRWYELGPKDWDPYQQLRDMRREIKSLSDADPRAAAMLAKMREVWNDAPINPALDGAAVRIPGYIVPIDQNGAGISEFLLVPYFGACIHSPPPPSNQIIHVKPQRALAGARAMDMVWVSGMLKALRSDSAMGASGYFMEATHVTPYVPGKPD